MKSNSGYNIPLAGRPSAEVEVLPEPQDLFLPLHTERFDFTRIQVEEGQEVTPGHILAKDPNNYALPLLAPREGTVSLDEAEGYVVLRDVEMAEEQPYTIDDDPEHIPQNLGSAGMQRYKLLQLGAWEFFREAHTYELPDPFGIPRAIIVSTLRLEPFMARGDVELRKRLNHFTRGLEHLQSLLEYQPIHLVVPDVQSELADRIRNKLKGYAWVQIVTVPLTYPQDNSSVLARRAGLPASEEAPVWALWTDGVLAVDRALTLSRPSTVRVVTLGGPACDEPRHVKAIPGYPLDALLATHSDPGVRVVQNGVLTGRQVGEDDRGLSPECRGYTLLSEPQAREFLGFMRPGADRPSYSNCFLSALRTGLKRRFTTAMWGERRPCISCIFCEEVCPVDIMPHQIHKYLYQDALEEAEKAGIDRCVACGLCSYVCPSKIELRTQLVDGQERVQRELHPEDETE